MNDLNHYIGADLLVGAGGDIAPVDGTDATTQRVLRRLLTAPGAYVWHPEYGAGLPLMVGSLATPEQVRGAIRQHIALESAVAQSPTPAIEVEPITGGVSVRIAFTDAITREQRSVGFDIKA